MKFVVVIGCLVHRAADSRGHFSVLFMLWPVCLHHGHKAHYYWGLVCHENIPEESLLTVDVADHRLGEAMPGQRHENFSGTLPPKDIVLGAPGRDGREEQHQVILPGQLFCRGCVGAQLHQNLARVGVGGSYFSGHSCSHGSDYSQKRKKSDNILN